jgi:hypothetical protein
MSPRGKRGKLQDKFPTLSTGLGNPPQNVGFPHFHSAGGGFINQEGEEK